VDAAPELRRSHKAVAEEEEVEDNDNELEDEAEDDDGDNSLHYHDDDYCDGEDDGNAAQVCTWQTCGGLVYSAGRSVLQHLAADNVCVLPVVCLV
jgi:hypothetical protein